MLRDTKSGLCITCVLLKRANGLNYCLNRIVSSTDIMDNIINQQQDRLHAKSPDVHTDNKGNNKITELRTILQRESQNS